MLRAYLELLRPANVITALADVLAGFAVAGLQNREALPWLLGSTACLYGGGVVLNDVFDRDLDRIERPERPIPSGRVPVARAAVLGGVLLGAGVILASRASSAAACVAGAIAAFVLIYDAWGKRHGLIAPLNMALCRALNLMLGVAAVPAALQTSWRLALIPLLYIWAVTALSRGEVHGGGRGRATTALIFLFAAVLALAVVSAEARERAIPALVLVMALAWRVVPAFWNARQHPATETIRRAVKRGVLSLVLVDAAIGAAYAGPVYAAAILATGLLAGWLARMFAVT
jgi:4-hydroxybenzoate polyprenyltransferase